jgi:hypothetical protein
MWSAGEHDRGTHDLPPLALPRSGCRVDGPQPPSQPAGASSPDSVAGRP